MNEAQNLETVRQVYLAFTQGNLQEILKPMASNVDWRIMGRYEKVPWAATWRGREALEKILRHSRRGARGSSFPARRIYGRRR